MKFEFRRIIAWALLFVAINSLAMTFSENVLCAAELPGAHEAADADHAALSGHPMDDGTCPDSPSHPTDDHLCVGDCSCPCSAPLQSADIMYVYSQSFSFLFHAEPIHFIPEVYLSLFVPPDSAVFV